MRRSSIRKRLAKLEEKKNPKISSLIWEIGEGQFVFSSKGPVINQEEFKELEKQYKFFVVKAESIEDVILDEKS